MRGVPGMCFMFNFVFDEIDIHLDIYITAVTAAGIKCNQNCYRKLADTYTRWQGAAHQP